MKVPFFDLANVIVVTLLLVLFYMLKTKFGEGVIRTGGKRKK